MSASLAVAVVALAASTPAAKAHEPKPVFSVVEATIPEMRAALKSHRVLASW